MEAAPEMRRRLEGDRQRLRESLRKLTGAARTLGEYQHAEGDGGGDTPADVASELMEQELDVSLARMERIHLTAVEAALRRMSGGRYGFCEMCAQPIDVARLRAIPWARTCIHCAEEAAGRVAKA
jgi:DnaK suppressor protein